MDLSTIIKEYRISHKLTMQEFADSCGLSKGYISMLENGRHPRNNKEVVPSLETYTKLSAAMHITLDELLTKLNIDYGYHDNEKNVFNFIFSEDNQNETIDVDVELEQLLSRINNGGGISIHGETLDNNTKELLVDSLTNTLKLINAISKKP